MVVCNVSQNFRVTDKSTELLIAVVTKAEVLEFLHRCDAFAIYNEQREKRGKTIRKCVFHTHIKHN